MGTACLSGFHKHFAEILYWAR